MKGLLSIISLFGVSLLFQFGTSASAFAQAPQNNTQATNPVPEHVLYEFYLRRIDFFENLAGKKEKDGIKADSIRGVIKNELGINEAQRAVFGQISAESLREVASIDAQAAAIIQREHARYPGGKLSSKDQVPQIPQELVELQKLRDSVFMNAKAQLFNLLGATAFQEIDSRIRSIITPGLNMTPDRQLYIFGSRQ